MKTLKTLLSAFAMVALFATGAMAQGQASIAATANVVTDVTLTAVQDLSFGAYTTSQLNSTTQTLDVTSANTDQLGKFQMTSLQTSTTIFSLSVPSALTNQTASLTSDDLPVSFSAKYSESNTDPDGTNTQTFPGSFELSTTPGGATAYVYVGGSLNPSAVAAGDWQGQYSGDITLSVYYD